jgi:plastocyanin
MRAITMALVLAAIVLGLAACGGGSNSNNSSSSESGSGKTELEMDDDYFEPKTVKGDPGQEMTLELKNEGNEEHNFTLTEQSVDQDVEAGEEAEVTVTVPQSGTLTFYCKYHRSKGMEGKLESSSMSSSSSGSTSSRY